MLMKNTLKVALNVKTNNKCHVLFSVSLSFGNYQKHPLLILGLTFIGVVSIEFSPLSTVELTTKWYQLHNGDYKELYSMLI